jgi:predicted dehydrogenase
MMTTKRRSFLKQAGMGPVLMTAAPAFARGNVNERVTLGVIGPGGMGSNHLQNLVKRDDVNIAWVCDVDSDRTGKAVETVTAAGMKRPQSTSDMRNVFDDKDVDAVIIATPDHWHGPAVILALNAGKHVYVEKPCCHNIREGQMMAAAVERSGKFLQVGTQSRSADFLMEAMQRIQEGEIGEVLVAKAWNSQRRGSIGKQKPVDPPAHLNFDTWVGPAPMVPYQKNLLHGVWRWWYDFGCGDIGNDGIHDIDVALWGLGITTLPTKATCIGGKYFFDDDQQFPDTQYAVFEYDEKTSTGAHKQMIFEQRIWSPYKHQGYENGQEFYGTKGHIVMGHTQGWKLYGERDKLLAERNGQLSVVPHHDNFLACVHGEQKKTNADIGAGVRSATLVHLANIAARTGRLLNFDPELQKIVEDEESNALLGRKYRNHWGTPA